MVGDLGDHAPEVEEGDIPDKQVYLNSLIEVTPESALVSTEINSPVGSGFIMYPNFRTAIWNTWAIGLESYYQDNGAGRLMGEAAPPELRAGRRAFKALLDRYDEAGYTPDMAEELSGICDKYCPDYGVSVGSVLPHDLEAVLDMAYPDEDDEDVEKLAGAPPRDAFDLNNPQHLEWLQQALEYLQYI